MDIQRLCRNAAWAAEMRKRARRNGHFGKHPLWTEAEDDLIKAMYPDYRLLCKRLRRRTFAAIKSRAHFLKITTPRAGWTGASVTLFKKLYPKVPTPQLVHIFAGRKAASLRRTASRLGLKKHYPRLKDRGLTITDQVRRRANKRGWTMADLDAFSKTKRYFQAGNFQHDEHWALLKAVAILEGKVKLEWLEED